MFIDAEPEPEKPKTDIMSGFTFKTSGGDDAADAEAPDGEGIAGCNAGVV